MNMFKKTNKQTGILTPTSRNTQDQFQLDYSYKNER